MTPRRTMLPQRAPIAVGRLGVAVLTALIMQRPATSHAQADADPARAVARAVAELLTGEIRAERLEGDLRLTQLSPDACVAPEDHLEVGTALDGDFALSGHGRDSATGELLIGVADASGALWSVSLDVDACVLRVRDDAHVVIRASAGWPLPALRPFGSTPVELPW